jgi:RNA polymerase sigma-70 factor (ECF subfamily)
MRDAGREVPAHGARYSATTSVSLAANLVGRFTSPTLAARRMELADRLRDTLEQMDATDREVLALRHLEELTNSEVAEELQIQQKAASIRYVRALRRLKEILADIPELADELRHGP